jgi:hypothetical protein
MSCFNTNCQLCRNLVISTSVTVVTVDGTDTLVIDIPTGVYANGCKVCLVIAQAIPTTATIGMPVAISIGGDTTTVYPIVGCNCNQITACAVRTRRKYPLRVSTNATSAVFRSLGNLSCAPNNVLTTIPVASATTAPPTEG